MALIAIVSMVVGAVASRFIVSPGDAAARSKAPSASRIAVPVERRELVSRVVTRGEIVLGDAFSLSIPPIEGAVVTERPPPAGSALAEGDLLVEVSERPVVVLAGTVPMYRDILPGSTGIDVEQLERSLQRLGFAPGTVDATFDGATEQALAELYDAIGYPPPEPSPEDLRRLEEARERVVDAQSAASDAGDLEVAEATVGVRDAERALVGAEGAARTALQEADGATRSAAVAVATTRQAEGAAVAAHAAAQENGASAVELRELEAAVGSVHLELVAAENELALAGTKRDQMIADSQASIDSAADQVTLAKQRLTAVTGGPDASRGQAELAAALADLAEIDARVGTPALRSELVFVPTLPATVSSVKVGLGSQVEGVIAEASRSTIEARTDIPERAHDLLDAGDSVQITASDDTFEATGTLVAIADTAAETGTFPARVSIDGTGLDALRIQGASVRITIPVGQTDGPVLVIPVSALFSSADGSPSVEVATGGEGSEQVAVRAGLSADGYVEVEGVEVDLKEGDMVIVGREH